MRVYDNGVYRDMTAEEEAQYLATQEEIERQKLTNPSSDDLMNELLGVSE